MYDFNVFQWDMPWNVLDRRSIFGMIIRLDSCARNSYTKLQQDRPGYVAPPSERVVLFSLAVVFGEIRRICQCIPNSKFFQVDLF